jgi:membrane protein required for colicin V production
MTLLDLLILAGLGVGAARGFSTGALRQVMSLLGVIVAFALAFQLMDPVGRAVAESLGLSSAVAPAAGFVVVFVGVQAVAFGLTRLVEGVLKALKLSVVNRVAGGVIGAGKAALLVSALFLVLRAFERPSTSTREEAALYGPVAQALPTAWAWVSSEWPGAQDVIDRFEVPQEWIPSEQGSAGEREKKVEN